ncbi:MAG TPA: DNA primase [Firmicutes bacterium]|nr:DNA primase [Bacillota bacterium]
MTPYFSGEVLDTIRAKNDIVDVISQYIPLTQAGRSYKALCPFHTERTPSFTVSPERQLFHCFGCGAGGDVFNFIMRMEGLGFSEAVQFLAQRAGVRLEGSGGVQGAGYDNDRELILKANELAATFFSQKLLHGAPGREALDYLKSRGISDETIERFRLGYSLPEWDSLAKHLEKSGIPPDVASRAGLLVRRREGAGFYDRFRGRVMFSIMDRRGRVIGFGGRVLDDSTPKYINSSDSPVFNKRHNLYGLNFALPAMARSGRAVLVEGYTDVLAAHQAGFDYTVASLGTALTAEQVRLLAGAAREVILAYDADTAGTAATLRGLELLLQSGLSVRVAGLPRGMDPDELIRIKGRDAFGDSLDRALGLVEYRLRLAREARDPSTTEGRVGIAREMVPVLASIGGTVAQREYVSMVALELGLPDDAIWDEIERYRRRHIPERRGPGGRMSEVRWPGARAGRVQVDPVKDKSGEKGHNMPAGTVRDRAYLQAERNLLHLAVEDTKVLARVLDEMKPESFLHPGHRDIYCAIVKAAQDLGIAPGGRAIPGFAAKVLEHLGDGPARELALEVFSTDLPDEDPGIIQRVTEDCIGLIRERRLRAEISSIEAKMREAEKKEETATSRELLLRLQQLTEMLGRQLALRGQPRERGENGGEGTGAQGARGK